MAIDPRLAASSGREIFNGNELLVKGALEVEGGVHLFTGYPGSPVSGVFDVLSDLGELLRDKGVRAYQANNEALAAAALNGSQMVGCRAIATMKSVGVHVAADALALANLAGAHPEGGAIVISGEDPWCESTQVPADSRFLFEHLRMVVVEPGWPQELKDWIGLSLKLSAAAGLYVGYIVTNAQADGGGTVEVRANQFPSLSTKQRIALETSKIDLSRVLLPPRTWQEELRIPERFAATMKAARELGINRIQWPVASGQWPDQSAARAGMIPDAPQSKIQNPKSKIADVNPQSAIRNPQSPLGFIVTGMGGPYLEHVLSDIGLAGAFPILRMGMSYPADVSLVREFAQLCQTMVVIEERRSFLEKNIRDGLFHTLPQQEAAEIASRLYGKSFPHDLPGIPNVRGLNPSLLAQILIPLIQATEQLPAGMRNGRLTAHLELMREASRQPLQIAQDRLIPRTPTFCPGCPHRDSAATLLELRQHLADPQYMQARHGRGPVDLVAHGDTGCYTMLMFAPTEQLMHNYSGMGLGAGTGSGIDPFITNKQIVFMGDSTFFHSGQIAISNAIKAGQDITFIILQNGTTAMTGHQEHPGTEVDLLGNRSFAQDIETIARGIVASSGAEVVRLSPADRDRYQSLLERTILRDGVKVIIADKECGITAHRTEIRNERKTVKEKGYLPRKTYMNVTREVCEDCRECTKQTACPGLTVVETDYGPKIDTDLTWCVNDGACERVRVTNAAGQHVKPCPSFEEVAVVHSRRKRYMLPKMDLDKLPEVPATTLLQKPGDAWRVHMAGVGGMGIGVATAILARAGHKEGYRVIFSDKKGLAIRNGGVYSQITFIKDAREGGGEKRHEGTEARRHEVVKKAESKEWGGQTSALDASLPCPPSVPSCLSASVPCIATGSIPFGQADLVLGIDILEAARAVDPREQFRVASKSRTAAVLNLYRQPTVYMLLGRQEFDPDELRGRIVERCKPDAWFARDLSKLCEERLGSKQFVNIMMLGVAYQLGYIPVSFHAIAWAIRNSIPREHRKNLKAFNIGRKLALEPRALPNRPEPVTWEQLLRNKSRILEKTRWRGRTWQQRFDQLVQSAIACMPALPEPAKYDLVLRIYDAMQYQNHRLARRYIDLVRSVYERDSAGRSYAATWAAIRGIAKAMLIKDEPYVSYLLTRYEKKQHDIAKYSVDVANGDRLVYRHLTSPEFNIGKWRIRLKIRTRDWQLKLMRSCKWLRKMPGWHRREAEFRDWYIAMLDRLEFSDERYDHALAALRCVDDVKGYREIRYPTMESARRGVEEMLSQPTAPAESEPRESLPVATHA